MSKKQEEAYQPQTRALHVGHQRTPEGEQSEPIFLTSSYAFESAQQAAARFSGDEPGNVYSRYTNPTVLAFEQRFAALDSAEACIATASGMSAILAACMSALKAGDHILASQSLFGTTISLFDNVLSRFAVTTHYVPLTDLGAWEQALKKHKEIKLLFVETPANPLLNVGDIKALSELAHQHDALLVVDNCFCTPILQSPLALGADIAVYSATKFIDGQGRCLGGVVTGDKELVGKQVHAFLRNAGPSMSPFNAWVLLKGLETLHLRMQAHSRNAHELAQWLQEQPQVTQVNYPGLELHPQHKLAKQQQRAFGGLLSFEVKGGRDEAWKVIDALHIISITANLGDAKTTVTHPATTTHARLKPEVRAQAGVKDNLIRISTGLEAVEDIKADIEQGLKSVG